MAESSGKQISDKKPLTASGAEVIFLVLLVAFGMGVCVWVERGFALFFPEPTEQRAFDTPSIKEKQEKLARRENEIKETEKQIDVGALDQLKQTAALESLKKLHPEIAQPWQGSASVLSAEVVKIYETAKMQQMAADEYEKLLRGRITSLKADAEKITQELGTEKQIATDKLRGEKNYYRNWKFGVSLGVPIGVVLIGWLIGVFVFYLIAGRRVWTWGLRPVLLVVGALLILLAYQAFEIAGAVFIGLLLFGFFLWRTNWSPKVGKKGTE